MAISTKINVVFVPVNIAFVNDMQDFVSDLSAYDLFHCAILPGFL